MSSAQPMTEKLEIGADQGERKLIRDENLLPCLSEADDSRVIRRGRFKYRDNPTTARSLVVNTDDALTRPSASFHMPTPTIVDLIHKTLAASGYPMEQVLCRCTGDTVTLSGVVRRYHHAQVAINKVRQLATGYRLDYQIVVVSAQDEHELTSGN